MMVKFKFLIVLILLMPVLTSCSGIKKELGFGRNSPDEFTVVKRAPLTLPPEYDLLPLVSDNATGNDTENTVSEKAKTVIFSSNKNTDTQMNSKNPEMALLNKVRASDANDNIRKEIDRENGYIVLDNDKGIVDKIIFWKDEEKQEDPIVDAGAENKRIQEKLKSGEKLDGSTVPVIQKKQSTIDKIFK